MSQVDVLPRIFGCEMPQELDRNLRACKTDADAAKVGTEWAIYQAKELIQYGVPSLHWFTYSDPSQVVEIAKAIY